MIFFFSLEYPWGGVFPVAGFKRESQISFLQYTLIKNKTPIIIGHGIKDGVIPIKSSENIYQ